MLSTIPPNLRPLPHKNPVKRRPKGIKALEMTESQIVNMAIRWLWANGCFAWRNNTGGLRDETGRLVRFGTKGSADIIGVNRHGKMVAVECKRRGKKLEPDQELFRDRILEKNAIWILCRCVEDLEQRKADIC